MFRSCSEEYEKDVVYEEDSAVLVRDKISLVVYRVVVHFGHQLPIS